MLIFATAGLQIRQDRDFVKEAPHHRITPVVRSFRYC